MRLSAAKGLAVVLACAAGLLILAAALRGPEYDEGYTAFVTGPLARPPWPETSFRIAETRRYFRPAPGPGAILGRLRRTDVHPPLYFWLVWAWRRCLGPDLFVTRLLSASLSLATLGLVARWAAMAGLRPALPVLLTLGCFGFVAPGIAARGFALAQLLSLLGLFLAWRGAARDRLGLALASGLVTGAASFTNYLTAFPAAAGLLWTLSHGPRRCRRSGAMLLGQLPFLAADAALFAAQRNSRIGQFAAFDWNRFAGAIVHDVGGALLGGLPLYVMPVWRPAVALPLGLILVAVLVVPVLRWKSLREGRDLWAMAAISPPLGLLAMAVLSHSLPVEIRYLTFALPPLCLLLAASFQDWRVGRWLLAVLLAVQTASLAGLLARPETMQPEGAAALAAARLAGRDGLVLLPRGNDGVGFFAAFATAAPGGMQVELLRPETAAAVFRHAASVTRPLVLVFVTVDDLSGATSMAVWQAVGKACQTPYRFGQSGFAVLRWPCLHAVSADGREAEALSASASAVSAPFLAPDTHWHAAANPSRDSE